MGEVTDWICPELQIKKKKTQISESVLHVEEPVRPINPSLGLQQFTTKKSVVKWVIPDV